MFAINRDVAWISGGQIIGIINNFLLLRVLTTSINMESYGYYALWMSIMLFIRQIVYDPFSIILAKESIQKNSPEMESGSSLQTAKFTTDRLLIVSVVAVIFFILISSINQKDNSLSLYALAGIFYLTSNGAQGIYINILNTLKKRKLSAIGVAMDSFVKLGLVTFVIIFIEKSLVVVLCAVALSSLLTFCWIRRICNEFNGPHFKTRSDQIDAFKQLIIQSLPLVAPMTLIAIKGVGDKVFMASFIGLEELAAYNVLLQLGFIPMMIVIGVIQTYVSADIYKLTSCKSSDKKETLLYIRKISLKILFLSVILVFLSYFLSDFIFKNLIGPEYLEYAKFLPFFVIAGSLSGVCGLLNVGVIGAFSSKLVGILMLSSVFSGLIIFVAAIVMGGFEGGIIGLILSNLVMVIIFGVSILLIKSQ
jgi:O-antigen/teichoic acid export membrane protein